MENEAVILRARAAQAKLAAEYATNDAEREHYWQRARVLEARAQQLEAALEDQVPLGGLSPAT